METPQVDALSGMTLLGIKPQDTGKDGGKHTLGHSKLPWKIDEDEDMPCAIIEDTAEGLGICEMEGENVRANAAFIVRACNNHDALVTMLQDVGAWLETHLRQGKINAGTANRDGDLVSQIRETLANATR